MLRVILFSAIAAAAAFELESGRSHPPLPGTIIATQLRCQGYLCPQWALDISRYDTIQYLNESFEYQLQEALPLAPTPQRSFHTFTAYDDSTREFTAVATDYPIAGVDAYWITSINDYANATSPLTTYVMIPHPGTSPNSGPNALLTRVMLVGGRKIAIFRGGCVHEVDITGQKYTKISSLFDKSGKVFDVTDAHVVDGLVLKSFLIDEQGVSYLVKSDFTNPKSVVVSTPVAIQPLQGMNGKERPIAAHMISVADGVPAKLVVLNAGNFDQINFVDEETGKQTYIFSNIYDEVHAIFMCNEDIKECDMWRTSAFDADNHLLYFQLHVESSEGVYDNSMAKVGFSQSKVNGEWYGYINIVHNFMNFGYSGYQYATIKQ